jgi:hypothetical protein
VVDAEVPLSEVAVIVAVPYPYIFTFP